MTIGHNGGPTFDDIVAENLERGLYWAQRDALIKVIRDPMMAKRHEIVLAELIVMTNVQTGVCYPGRKHIADATGYTEGTVATTIKELASAGYIVSTKRAAEPGSRALSHYAVVKPTVEDLRAAVDAHIAAIRASNSRVGQSSRRWSDVKPVIHVSNPEVNPVVHVNGADVNPDIHVNGSDVKPVLHVNGAPQSAEVNPVVHVNGPTNKADVNPVVPTVTSTSNNNNSNSYPSGERGAGREPSHRGTRLPADWRLPKTWGDWAVAECVITPAQVRREADNFRDFWISKAGSAACKLDWQATWRNWIRRDYADRVAGAQTQHDAKPDAIDLILAAGRPKFGGGS